MRLLFFVISLLLSPGLAFAGPSGPLKVIDGDTFDVGGVRVRLFAVDAPEIGQICAADGREWDCGVWVRDLLRSEFGGRHATCIAQHVDRYGRVVATCAVAGRDLGAHLVSEGLAWAYRRYSSRYEPAEEIAALAHRGLWRVTTQSPAAFRAAGGANTTPPDPVCTIKGNISTNGYIYHMPGTVHYARTVIDETRGERWFYTQSEAEIAGWHPAKS